MAGTHPVDGAGPTGTAPAMSGLEFLRAWRDGRVPSPPMSAVLAFDLFEVDEGRVVFAGTPSARFYNPIETVHGGYAATLLDSRMGSAVRSRLAAGQTHTTAEIKIQYVSPITDSTGPVTAESVVLHFGRRMATVEGYLRDAGGRPLAHASTRCMVFTEP